MFRQHETSLTHWNL